MKPASESRRKEGPTETRGSGRAEAIPGDAWKSLPETRVGKWRERERRERERERERERDLVGDQYAPSRGVKGIKSSKSLSLKAKEV